MPPFVAYCHHHSVHTQMMIFRDYYTGFTTFLLFLLSYMLQKRKFSLKCVCSVCIGYRYIYLMHVLPYSYLLLSSTICLILARGTYM